ncbi:amidohydrolase family-domain-containing protein [Podospora australis]|uniref:Amidohydrolase family-domain-containing protein n=1 Tax=Podospora australis TaxID=1536484 RepID=A0AAN6WKR0_9PEZI|nr:amidohydrolase family-domain-containing protein [Podospora australis]
MCGGASTSLLRALLGNPQDLERDLRALQNAELQTETFKSAEADNDSVVIYRGTILTMAFGKFNPVEAMAVQGDTIVATGTYDQVQAAVSQLQVPHTERDLGSQCIVPGFVEPHLHLLPTALVSGLTDMWLDKVKNIDQAKEVIEAAVKAVKPGDWIIAFGYDPSLTSDHIPLTRDITDAAAPSNPFFCGNPSGHLGYANTAAFIAAGIAVRPNDPNLNYPAGNPYYVKATDEQGEYLTGVVLETAVNEVSLAFPKPFFSPDRLVCLGREALTSWAKAGCTSLFDAGIGVLMSKLDITILLEILAPQSTTPVIPRFNGAIAAAALDAILGLQPGYPPTPPPYINGPLNLYTVKFWLDGSTQGFTAALNQPYASSTNPFNFPCGFLDYRLGPKDLASGPNDSALLDQLNPVIKAGWQAMLHVNGSRAIDQALRVLPQALPLGPQPPPYMHRLEHFTADVTREQITAVAKLGLGVSHLIAHVGTWGDAFVQYIFEDHNRAARIDPFAEEIAAGLTVSLHSDSFTSPVAPLRYVDTAVTRRTRSGDVLGPEQAVSLEQAFAGVTYHPAKQMGQLDKIGSLEKRKKADFVILSEDPRNVEAGELFGKCKVVQTWIGGLKFV